MVKVIENYIINDLIGEGAYGKVYKAINTKKEGDFAIKIISVDKFNQNSKLEQCTFNQIKILSTIGLSPHIVRYYEMLKTKNNFYFVYEYCNGGDLLTKIKRQHHIPQAKAMQYFRQILEAFKILNKFNIMHRDIKAENIFLHNDEVKLGDFGFCKGLQPEQNMTRTMLGSPIYMAPQVLRGDAYSTKADVWSLGVILYEMLYGKCPFESNSIGMLINTIKQTQLCFPSSPYVSSKTQNIIKKMLTKDYFRRIGWIQLFGEIKYFKQQQNTLQQLNRISYKGTNSQIKCKVYENDFGNRQQKNKQQKLNKKCSSIPKNIPQERLFYSKRYKDIIDSINRRVSLDRADQEKALQQIQFNQDKSEREKKYLYQYSQRKIDILNSQNKVNEHLKQQANKPLSLQTPSYRRLSEIQIKRNNLLKTHTECIQLLYIIIKDIQSRNTTCFSQTLRNLSKIKTKLNWVSSQITMTEMQLLDISSIINFQVIQVDRQISQIKQYIEMYHIQPKQYLIEY